MRKAIIIITIIGIMGIAINTMFGNLTFTWLHYVKVNDYGMYLYKFDAWGYISNIKNSFTDVSVLGLTIPTRTWQVGEWTALTNNLALLVDWLLFLINVFIWPFRVGGYTTKQLLALIGINVIDANAAGGLQWLVNLNNFLVSLQIQYI